MEGAPKVGNVVITTANGMKYLPVLLPSIARQTYSDHETTVVVDGADPGVLAYLSAEWADVHVVPIPEGGGFARAIDRGVRSSRGGYIGILNDDIELEPGWLELLVGELDRDPALGFATGKTLLYDDREVINEANQDLYSCGRFEPRGSLERDVGQYDQLGPTTIASASASVYRRAAVEQAGGFDTDYGIYCEDADLCLRMILSGYHGRYLPEARAYHAWAPTMGRTSDRAMFLGNRNALVTLAKDFPGPLLLRSLPKVLRYQRYTYKVARANQWARTLLKAWSSFLRMLPGTLRKRRHVQRRRAISSAEFEAFLLSEYPDLPEVVRDPRDMHRFEPARLRLIVLDLIRRVRVRAQRAGDRLEPLTAPRSRFRTSMSRATEPRGRLHHRLQERYRSHRIRRFLSPQISPGDLAFDIGANVGEWSAVLRLLGAEVVAVEPQAECVASFREQVAADAGVRVVESAVADWVGEGSLRPTTTSTEHASMSDDWRTVAIEKGYMPSEVWLDPVEVPVTTVDALIDEYGAPSFCKIDVEGFEPRVLRGLSRPLPRLAFEFHRELPEAVEGCVERLAELGEYRYRLFVDEWLDPVGGELGPEELGVALQRQEPGTWGMIAARRL